MVAEGQLTAGHARALLATPDRAFQEQLARRAVEEHWTVRETEDAVREQPVDDSAVASGARPVSGLPTLRPPGLLELEGLLAEYLNTRVSISMRGARGKVAVEFATLEDLERIYRLITESSEHTFD
jgi:ParB family chromosome partitioning protein